MPVRNEVQAVIFDEREGGTVFLLVKKVEVKTGKSRWRLLKGGMEEGETETEALNREIFEETGLRNIKILREINRYVFSFRDMEHRVTCFLVKGDSKEPVRLQSSEVVGCVWVSKDEAYRMLYWPDEKKPLEKLG